MRDAETILLEKLEQGKDLQYVLRLATALGRDDLRKLAEDEIRREQKQVA